MEHRVHARSEQLTPLATLLRLWFDYRQGPLAFWEPSTKQRHCMKNNSEILEQFNFQNHKLIGLETNVSQWTYMSLTCR